MKKNLSKVLSIMLALSMVIGMSAVAFADTEAAYPTYTYNTYSSSLGNNWNPHTWETNADDTIQSYLSTPFCTMTIDDSENGVYQWIYEAATAITDVTAEHQDDLTKYNCTLPAGMTAEEVEAGYVFELALNPEMKWENGEPINADTYIYSMQQLLDPAMKNYRANLYYAGESAVAGGNAYYYSDAETVWTEVAYDDVMADATNAAYCVDCWGFWGAEGYVDAEGNEVPQYVSITDETAYSADGAGNDEFTGAMLFNDYNGYLADGGYLFTEVANENFGATFDGVGCYKVDDYTIRYVMQTQIDPNYALVSFTSNWLVYEPYYEAGKDTTGTLVTTDYCTSMENTMSYGAYKIESLQPDKQIVFTQNENWFGYEKQEDGSLLSMTDYLVDGESVQQYQTTKVVIDVMDDAAAKQAFLKGELTDWTPSADDLTTYATSEQLYKVDETYTESFFFNTGVDALKAMDESKGNTNSVVLSNTNFRKAMSLSIDRDEFVTATQGWKPAYAIMNNLYFYDVYNDPTSSYRSSDEAMQAICNLYEVEYGEGTPYATLKDAYDSINGYNLTEAQALMKTACEELVAEGLYTAGEDIYVRVGFKKGALDSTDSQQIELINKYVNAALEGSGFGKITFEAIGNINDRYGDVSKGEYAIGWGAWGGAAFYPFRNFQVYCDTEQYEINEAGCWDPSTEKLTLTVDGEEVTMTWQDWSRALIGTGAYANADFATKLSVTAQMEELYLKKYYRIPFAGTTACSMLAYKASYYTEEYNIMYDFGGLRLMTYNYNDAEWADFVAEEGGTLSYE